jgi:hypothetical protein
MGYFRIAVPPTRIVCCAAEDAVTDIQEKVCKDLAHVEIARI